MKKILVFSGAGVSAESGIKTFRDHDGLWNEYRIEEVATPEAWKSNPDLVLDFYNKRRNELQKVLPNMAHDLIAELQRDFEVTVITQNVDDLHERAGSKNVVHLHGELLKVRSTIDDTMVIPWIEDLKMGDLCKKGSQLRPHIVWFGEMLNDSHLLYAKEIAEKADFCIIIGTSMQVFPAAEIPYLTQRDCPIFIVDPKAEELNLDISEERILRIPHIASEGMKQVSKNLKNYSE